MAIKRYDGNKSKQDGTKILRILDAGSVLRDIKAGDTIDLTQGQIDALGARYFLSDTTDPIPTAQPAAIPLMSTDVIGTDGKIKSALLPVGSGGSNTSHFKGPWAANTAYVIGDVVSNGTTLFQATANFTSGSSFNQSNWVALGGAVQTVNGEAGPDVSLTPADIGAIDAAQLGMAVGVARYSGSAYPPRPVGFALVIWEGPIDPAGSSVDGDLWVDNS